MSIYLTGRKIINGKVSHTVTTFKDKKKCPNCKKTTNTFYQPNEYDSNIVCKNCFMNCK